MIIEYDYITCKPRRDMEIYMSNSSLDFLNMIKNGADSKPAQAPRSKTVQTPVHKPATLASMIAVIDTETNWRDEVMSIGVALADTESYKCSDKLYYIFDPECRVGGMFSGVLSHGDIKGIRTGRKNAMDQIKKSLTDKGIAKIFAYNGRFDLSHLPELGGFEWYDIMRVAAYKQFNKAIPDSLPCCKTGRLKTNYGVEPILRILSRENRYCEIHNAVYDAMDELRIMELLKLPLSDYEVAKIN